MITQERKEQQKAYRLNNKEKIAIYNKVYRLKNKEFIKQYNLNNKEYLKEYHKKYRLNNKEYFKEHNKEYNLKNKEHIKEHRKEYYLKNREDILKNKKKYYLINKKNITKTKLIYEKKQRENNPNYKLRCYLRTRMYSVLKGINKSASTMKLIGCSIDELWNHLESKFESWMTKENYGLWHVDHIIACAKFDLTCPVQQLACFNYKNLQPLSATDNKRKGAR